MARRITRLALLTAVAVVIHALEAQIPPLAPVPGIKLGLSNAVTLFAMLRFGRRDAGIVLAARIILGGLLAGSFSSLVYSASGGLAAFIVSALIYKKLGYDRAFVTGAFSAVAHGFAQMLVAVLITETAALWMWLALMTAAGIVTGAFTGYCAGYAGKRLGSVPQ